MDILVFALPYYFGRPSFSLLWILQAPLLYQDPD